MQRQMPRAELAEQNIIAAIFLEPELVIKAADYLTPSDFYNQSNAQIFEAMLTLNDLDKKIDFVSIGEYFNQNPKGSKIPIEYIRQLAELLPSSSSFDTYMDLVLDASLKRSVIKITSDIAERGLTQDIDALDFLELTEQQVFDLATMRRASPFQDIKELAHAYYEKTEYNQRRGGRVTGLDTGFEALNRITSGFQPEEVIIIAARPGMGKSAFAVNLALNIAKPRGEFNRKHVALFSLEMSNEQIVGRMLSNLSGINSYNLRNGDLTPDEWKELNVSVQYLSQHSIYFDDTASSKIGELRAKSRQKKQEGKLDVIIIDYLQLLTSGVKTNNRQEEVSVISRSLKQLAKELKVPIIALSQLSRNVERRESNEPILADLRESGSIEQDADIVMFLHSEDYYDRGKTESSGEMEVIIAKNRSGRQGRLKFRFEPKHSRFFPREERDIAN